MNLEPSSSGSRKISPTGGAYAREKMEEKLVFDTEYVPSDTLLFQIFEPGMV
jgi:hypothetical protein